MRFSNAMVANGATALAANVAPAIAMVVGIILPRMMTSQVELTIALSADCGLAPNTLPARCSASNAQTKGTRLSRGTKVAHLPARLWTERPESALNLRVEDS